MYLIYQDTKGRWYHGNQWTISATVQEAYRLFRDSFRGLYNIKEVPESSILMRVASIPFRTFALLNFMESSETETLVYSKRISRKYEWGIFFLISLLLYDVFNILSFLVLSIHQLPFFNRSCLFWIIDSKRFLTFERSTCPSDPAVESDSTLSALTGWAPGLGGKTLCLGGGGFSSTGGG